MPHFRKICVAMAVFYLLVFWSNSARAQSSKPEFSPAAPASTVGSDVKTVSGRIYKNARVFRVEPDGVTYLFTGGMAKIPFDELPQEVQTKYRYSPEKTAAFLHAQEVATQLAISQERDEKNRQMAEGLKAMTLPLREVESDMPSYIDREFVVHGTIEISAT